MFGGLPGKPTGLAMSVLRRAEAFAEAGISTDILVDHFYPDFDVQVSELADLGRIGGDIRVRYLYDELSNRRHEDRNPPYVSPLGGIGWTYDTPTGRPDMLVGRQEGEYRQRVLLRDEKVLFIDHLDQGTWDRREWFDGGGRLCKIERMGRLGKCHQVQYIDQDGNCYLQESKDEATQRVRSLEVYPGSPDSAVFDTKVGLFKYWMQRFVLLDDPNPTIISEYGTRRVALDALESENNAKVIYTVHSNHLSKPHRYGGRIRPEMSDFFSHLDEYRAVVVLTHEQQMDVWKQYGRLETVHVVPHYVPASRSISERDQKRVVMVGRFEPIKGQLIAIGAFKQVVAAVPDAKLELYGRGPDQERIEKAISELGLSQNVSIMGFTADPDSVFRSAGMSIVASDYEGFCLSLAESMAAGCVPVSFDVKYGPRDLINNGSDGFLVEHGNENELADAIMLGLSNPAYLDDMSENAINSVSKLSKERFMDDWRRVLAL